MDKVEGGQEIFTNEKHKKKYLQMDPWATWDLLRLVHKQVSVNSNTSIVQKLIKLLKNK